MTPQINPLNDEHCKCIDDVLARIPPLLELARACKDCGLPMEDFIEGLEAQHRQATKMKATFFPNRV